MATNDALEGARRFVEEGWRKGNLEVARELLANDLVNHRELPGQRPGREGFLQTLSVFHDAFPERRFIPEGYVVEGNKVSAFWSMVAFHKGEFYGVAPTGKLITTSGSDWYYVHGGKIVEVWHQQDVFGVMMELMGILP